MFMEIYVIKNVMKNVKMDVIEIRENAMDAKMTNILEIFVRINAVLTVLKGYVHKMDSVNLVY
jgi:hypothetical protein